MKRELTDEQRAEPRVEAEEPLETNLRAGGRFGRGHLIDINNKGAFVRTEMALEPGETVTLEIQIPGSDRLESVRGVVARQQGGPKTGLGIEFLPTSVEERDHLYYVVKTILALDLLGYEPRKGSNPSGTIAYGRPVYRPDDES